LTYLTANCIKKILATNQIKDAQPRVSQFLIPSNPVEHKPMAYRMISGGLLRSEAEQNKQSRKAACNKAHQPCVNQ
jgi:hypothetical protein